MEEGMTLQEQYDFLDELLNLYLHRDKQYSAFLHYEGEYGRVAGSIEEVMHSISRLIGLDK